MPRPATKKAPAKYASKKSVPAVRGRGTYTYEKPGPWGKWGRSAGRSAGGMLGSNYGVGKLGARVGEKLGSYLHYIGKIFGSGDYVTSSAGVKSNNLIGAGAQAPQFDGSTTVRIRHREYLGDIISSSTPGAFQIQSFPINPGLTATFPWLANVCGATFQQYRINGMIFEYRSMSADALNSVNTALGTVVMCTDYDSADVPFTSKQQMENTMFGVSCKPACNMIHAIECARFQTSISELYIRAYGIPPNTDPRLYDMGNFYIATVGMQGSSVNCGELWVTYDVSLIKSIEQVPLYIAPFAYYTITSPGAVFGPLGSAQTKIIDQIGLTLSNTFMSVAFPSTIDIGSVWELYYYLIGTSTSLVSSPGTTVSGGFVSLSQVVNVPDGAPGTSNKIQYVNKYKYLGGGTTSSPPTIIIGAIATYPTSITACNLKIFQVSGTFASTPALSLGTNIEKNMEYKTEVESEGEDTEVPEYISVHEEEKAITKLSQLRIKTK